MTSVLFYNPDNTPEELAHSSPPSHNDANWPWFKTNHPHDNQPWKKDDTKPPNIPGLARLNILQGFSLLGGAGSVVHEIHAVEYQKALALASSEGRYRPWSTNSTDKAEVPTMMTTDLTMIEKETTEGANAIARGGGGGGGDQLWPWSWAQKLQAATTGSRGTMKRYRITIEELPGEVSADGSALASTSASATSTADVAASEAVVGAGLEDVKKVATTTAMMPTGVIEWLLNVSYDKPYGFRTPPVEEKKGSDESPESAAAVVAPVITVVDEVVPQVPLPDQDPSSLSSVPVVVVAASTAPPPTAESSGGAGPEPVATKIESPVIATSAASTVVDQLAVASAAPVPAKPSEAAPSSVLVNKVMEVRPSWDNNNNTSQDSPSRTREWPPHRRQDQRRPSESFTQTTITRPDGTVESKTVTFNRQSGVTETHTRIQRPDGSFLESSTHRINPSLRDAQEKEQQQQPVPQTRHEGENPYRNHLNRVAIQQQQQQQQQQQNDAKVVAATTTTTSASAAASTSTPPTPPSSSSSSSSPSQHRPSFRERWAQRRQEHREFLEELRAERERERPHTSQDCDQGRGRQDDRRRERRQELRDAEAKQRETTAAAYGFVPSSSSSSSSASESSSSLNGPRVDREREDHRHHHRDRLRLGRRKEDEEKEDDGEGRQQYRSRSWPPKGYLKRQEREQQDQQQSRHNV
ncbi:hypothetical protein KI688_011799 [Linnemannia hyalina]|uniref:Uncharacterized protein n=1 Tax=Linnemannia hyalina TaxID=64524 RepID=A0A9P7XYH3_9FUNG|nr:hypothetical protein KI688_011799 [Linnemannia hyalina]